MEVVLGVKKKVKLSESELLKLVNQTLKNLVKSRNDEYRWVKCFDVGDRVVRVVITVDLVG